MQFVYVTGHIMQRFDDIPLWCAFWSLTRSTWTTFTCYRQQRTLKAVDETMNCFKNLIHPVYTFLVYHTYRRTKQITPLHTG